MMAVTTMLNLHTKFLQLPVDVLNFLGRSMMRVKPTWIRAKIKYRLAWVVLDDVRTCQLIKPFTRLPEALRNPSDANLLLQRSKSPCL